MRSRLHFSSQHYVRSQALFVKALTCNPESARFLPMFDSNEGVGVIRRNGLARRRKPHASILEGAPHIARTLPRLVHKARIRPSSLAVPCDHPTCLTHASVDTDGRNCPAVVAGNAVVAATVSPIPITPHVLPCGPTASETQVHLWSQHHLHPWTISECVHVRA